jgi:plastocyanin
MRRSGWPSSEAVIGITLALTVSGCTSKPSTPEVGSTSGGISTTKAAPPVVNALDPATLGDITGVARLAGKAPAPVRIDTSMDPACATNASGDEYSEQFVVKGDRLANVYVYVKSGPDAAMNRRPTETAPVVVDQKGCVYTPHVVAVGVGQPVEFRNSDPTMHNIETMAQTVGNSRLDVSQGPMGKPKQTTFAKPEVMMSVRCNLHPWMNAFINVSGTPWFTVTGPEGKFELKGLPEGQYILGAVQEKLGEQEIKVSVKPKAATQADVTFASK